MPSFAFATPGMRPQSQLLMGTIVSISAVHSSKNLADEGIAKAFARMAELEKVFSRHDSSSLLGILNAQGSLQDIHPALRSLLEESLLLYKNSHGAFDISVAPLVDLLESGRATDKELAEARALADISSLQIDKTAIRLNKSGMALTLDGIAKGAIIDEASKAMREAGLENFILNAGGDIYAAGAKEPGKSWKIAIESPEKDGKYPAVISLTDRAVATSGGYERPGHLINPKNGNEALTYRSVSVSAPSVKEADALATALSSMPLQSAKAFVAARPGCSALFIDTKGKLHSSNWA